MKLQSLSVTIQPEWTKDAGMYTGKVKFKSTNDNEVTLVLDHNLSQLILKVVANELVATSRRLSTELTTECIDMAVNTAVLIKD